jgi:hypothetical protein
MELPVSGARVLNRGEEWVVRGANQCALGGYDFEYLRGSETARHGEALFLTQSDSVRGMKPREKELVGDDTPAYIGSRSYLETRLRQTVTTRTALALGHQGATDILPIQLAPTRQVLEQVRPRFRLCRPRVIEAVAPFATASRDADHHIAWALFAAVSTR